MRIALILLILAQLPASAFAQQAKPAERWDRAVCLFTEKKKSDGNRGYASAFLVKKSNDLFLVTALHAAKDTDGLSKLLFRNRSSESKWATLDVVADCKANPWRSYQNSDIAVAKLNLQEEKSRAAYLDLDALAIDYESIPLDTLMRTTEIEITGFPIGIGSVPPISSLAMKGSITSREMMADAQWGAEPIIYAVPVVGAGCSGGPVFKSSDDVTQCDLVGMYIGMAYDPTGVKLSKIVPSRIIRLAIDAFEPSNAETAK